MSTLIVGIMYACPSARVCGLLYVLVCRVYLFHMGVCGQPASQPVSQPLSHSHSPIPLCLSLLHSYPLLPPARVCVFCVSVCVRACARGWPRRPLPSDPDPVPVPVPVPVAPLPLLPLPSTSTTGQQLHSQGPAISPAVPRPRYSGVVWPSCPAGVPRLDRDQAGPLLHMRSCTDMPTT